MSGRWHAALGFALTGTELDLPEPGRPVVADLLAALAGAGWTAERIGSHARGLAGSERPWPHPVPARLRAGCGAAQFAAALSSARADLQLATLETRAPSVRRALNADEQRLLRDVPPHHGS